MVDASNPNLYPIHSKMVPTAGKEALLKQKGIVFWLTGLSGSGKSTLAMQCERALHEAGHIAKLLDGDNVRKGINSDLGFSIEDREENIRRVAEIAGLFSRAGIVTLCSFISPTRASREMARQIVGPDRFRLIHVSTSLEACENRDPKGLYKRARKGEIPDFTGIHSPYEKPEQPDFVIDTGAEGIERSTEILMDYISREIQYQVEK